jgi:hypothetical protein
MNPRDKAFIESARPLFRRRRALELAAAGGFAVVIISYFIVRWGSDGVSAVSLVFLVAGFVALIVIEIKLLQATSHIERRMWELFTQAYAILNANVSPVGELSPAGVIGKAGNVRAFTPVFTGTVGAYSVTAFMAEITYGQARRSQIKKLYRVLEVTTQQTFTNIYLDGRKNNNRLWRDAMTYLRECVSGNQKLKVEGDVNRFFDIYIAHDKPYENLVTLTPDKLLALRNYGSDFDIEFVDNKIYIMSDYRLKSPEHILEYQASIFELLAGIGAELTRSYEFSGARLTVGKPSKLAIEL